MSKKHNFHAVRGGKKMLLYGMSQGIGGLSPFTRKHPKTNHSSPEKQQNTYEQPESDPVQ